APACACRIATCWMPAKSSASSIALTLLKPGLMRSPMMMRGLPGMRGLRLCGRCRRPHGFADARLSQYFDYEFFFAVRHQMDAGNARDLLDLLDDLDADPHTLVSLIGGFFHALDDGIGNVNAGHMVAEPERRPR